MGDLEIKSRPGGTPRFSRFYSVIRKISSIERHHLLQYPFQFIIRKTTSYLAPHNPNNFKSYYVRDKYTGLSKKMDGIWNRYNLKSTGRIYTFGILKCSEKFKVLDLP